MGVLSLTARPATLPALEGAAELASGSSGFSPWSFPFYTGDRHALPGAHPDRIGSDSNLAKAKRMSKNIFPIGSGGSETALPSAGRTPASNK